MISLPKQPSPYLPPNWIQSNNSDVNDSLWASFNLDLSENEGKIRLGKRILLNWGKDDDSNLTSYPVGFSSIPGTTGIFTVAGSYIWANATSYPAGAFARLVNGVGGVSGSPTNCDSTMSDISFLSNSVGNYLYVTANSTSVYYSTDGLTWSSKTIGAGGSPKMLTPYAGRMYMTSGGNNIYSWTDPATIPTIGDPYTLKLGNNETITSLRSASNRIWITTINTNGKGYVYEWDGVATQVTKAYRLEALGALACVIKDDVPYIIDSNAALLAWNGGTFVKLDQFYRRNNKLLFNPLSTANNRFIHPNGMSIIRGKINILIDGRNYDSNATLEETIASGIWEYDDTRGLTHKHAIGQTKSGGTIADYGQARLAGVGGLAEFNLASTSAGRNGTFILGASYYSDATTVKSGVFYDDSNDTLQKAGYLITSKIAATDENGIPSVQNTWQNAYLIYKKLLNSTDKFVTKYRTSEADPVEATITWVNTTSFTVANSAVDISQYWTAGKGGEVEIQNGIGAGRCSHITNAVLSTGTWTVTVDETYTGVGTSTAIARFQNWKWLSTSSYTQSGDAVPTFDQQGINLQSNWVQFKVWMLFTGKNELEKFLITNQNTNPAN